MTDHGCRACGSRSGHTVLDLGEQPACDYFPPAGDDRADPEYPLQMWLCSSCGLAQLLLDPTVPEEPKGTEPEALVEQAAEAVGRVAAAGWLAPGRRVAEYGSPHGGSWLGLLSARGLMPVGDGEEADVIVDCFGMMHAADQSAALAERSRRLAPGGVLLLQYHSLSTILRLGQWNALRHGHYAYYSTTALMRMLAAEGLRPRLAWQFELYGGTVLLAVCREPGTSPPDTSVRTLLADEDSAGVRHPASLRRLQTQAEDHTERLHRWLLAERQGGRAVLGYGAASRAVALLRRSRVNRTLLPAVVDASPTKHGLRIPGTDIPIVGPEELVSRPPHSILLLVPDLLSEVRRTLPMVEATGGRWVDAEAFAAERPEQVLTEQLGLGEAQGPEPLRHGYII